MSMNAVHGRRRDSKDGVKSRCIEIAAMVGRCAASAPWQDIMLCLMKQECRQLAADMTLSVTNK